MKYKSTQISIFLIFSAYTFVSCNEPTPELIDSDYYALSYYYDDAPGDTLRTSIFQRILREDSFCEMSFAPGELKDYTFQTCYSMQGQPLGSGGPGSFNAIHENRMDLEFRGRDTTIFLDTSRLIDPTGLWFWSVQPEKGDTTAVQHVMKNFITNSVDFRNVYHSYLGIDRIEVLSQLGEYHLVRSWADASEDGVYDNRWFDDKGMMVREEHYVGASGVRFAVLDSIQERNSSA